MRVGSAEAKIAHTVNVLYFVQCSSIHTILVHVRGRAPVVVVVPHFD